LILRPEVSENVNEDESPEKRVQRIADKAGSG